MAYSVREAAPKTSYRWHVNGPEARRALPALYFGAFGVTALGLVGYHTAPTPGRDDETTPSRAEDASGAAAGIAAAGVAAASEESR